MWQHRDRHSLLYPYGEGTTIGINIAVVISGDSSGGEGALDKIIARMEEMNSQQKGTKASSDDAKGGLDGLAGSIQGVMAAAGSSALLALVGELDQVGAGAQRAGSGLDVMTGGKSLEWMAGMADATGGLADDEDLARVATKLLGEGLVTTKEQAEHMVRTATVLGGAFSTMTPIEATEKLAMFQNTMSPRLVKEFGINIDVLRDRITALKDANTGLSDQQIAMQAFYEQADPLVSKFNYQLNDQQAKLEKLAANWNNLKDAVGISVADALEPALDGANNLTGGLNQWHDAVSRQTDDLSKQVIGWNEYRNAIQTIPGAAQAVLTADDYMVQKHGGILSQNSDLYKSWLANQHALEDQATSMADSASAAEMLQGKQAGLTSANQDALPTLDQLVAKLEDVNKALETSAKLQLTAQQDVGKLTGLWWGAGTATKGTGKDIADLSKSLDSANLALQKQNISWNDANKHSDLSVFNLGQQRQKVDDLSKSLADAQSKQSFGAGADMGKIFAFTTGQLQNMGLSASQTLAKYNDLGLATGQVTALDIAQGKALTDLNKLYGDSDISTETYLTGLSKIPAAQQAVTASSIAASAAMEEATQKVKAAGGSAQEIINSAIEAGQKANKKTNTDDMVAGIKSTIDQINAMPGAQLKVLPDDAIAAITNVTSAIETMATKAASTPATIKTDTGPAEQGVAQTHKMLDGIKDKTVTVTVVMDDKTGAPAGGAPPAHQHGTVFTPGGMTLVGEAGPELVNMPRGAQVKNNVQTNNLLNQVAQGGDTFNIQQVIVQTPDANINQAIAKELRRQAKPEGAQG